MAAENLINHNNMSDKKKRYILPEEEIPHYWYNIQADMVNKPMPPLHLNKTAAESGRSVSNPCQRTVSSGA